MSGPSEGDATPITSVRDLAEYVAGGAKPRAAWRIGTEHEKFAFRRRDLSPPPYDAPDGIRALLEGHMARGWQPALDNGNVIGLRKDGANISLEPGGQFELSGAPLATLHETKAELDAHLAEAKAVGEALGLGFLPHGFHPLARREDMPWMPKSRYAIMRRYMPKKGRLGLDMMLRTCTVQVNLDVGDEADMVEKFRVSLALQPVAVALFANSPFTEGRANGFRSFRAHTWTDTDPDRCGIPAVVFEQGFGFERYVEWVLDVPMYFVYRQGRYIDVAGRSFRDFMAGKLRDETDGAVATIGDFADHLTTVFTEVRLKRYLEMRGADSGPPEMLMALPALWVGLLYDAGAQAEAAALIRDHACQEWQALHRDVPQRGLATPFCDGTALDLARAMVGIARRGLVARGLGEEVYLAPLEEIAATGRSLADHWLDRAATAWGGDISRIFAEGAL
ncbi:glutamate--cysteine ligase [Elioraea sp. Yellowstone]|jgi:glutamate--cysteine ligase|uniref:glutamate--cysteine ligase n=1 Tax=Elioraea sp. Yellowstone TaxID=2592070 RepID=UPI001150F1FA|nr:glutamate--cysteine ligase [Elioraea sp. Yellowstone]TQF77611.1 glutamate--cysteine ligase [Elioraea sp. Yellowstone]